MLDHRLLAHDEGTGTPDTGTLDVLRNEAHLLEAHTEKGAVGERARHAPGTPSTLDRRTIIGREYPRTHPQRLDGGHATRVDRVGSLRRLEIASPRPRFVCFVGSRTEVEPDNDRTDTPATMAIDPLFFLSLVSTLTWIGVPPRLASVEVRAAVEHAWVHDVPLRITYNGARETTERNVRIEAVLLERTMTLLNCHDIDIDIDIDDKRQFRLHQVQRAEVLPGIQ